jgi:hypothetical protein
MSLSNNSPKCGALTEAMEATEASEVVFHKVTYELLTIIILAGRLIAKAVLTF